MGEESQVTEEIKFVEEKERATAELSKKRKVEKERRGLEEKRRKVETKKWSLESLIEKVSEEIKKASSDYQGIIDQEKKMEERIREIEAELSGKKEEKKPKNKEEIICPNCGAKNKTGQKFCTQCGKPLEG